MSKLVNAVTYSRTDTQYPRPARITVQDAWKNIQPWETFPFSKVSREYRIGVSLEYKARVTEEMFQASDTMVSEVVAVGKRAVIEEVFGEFRPHFRDLEVALYECDFEKARQVLRAFESQMFSADNPK